MVDVQNIKDQFRLMAMTHNLNLVVGFYSESKKSISTRVDEINKEIALSKKSITELEITKKIYQEQMSIALVKSTFLLLYSYLEEELLLVERDGKLERSNRKSGSITRFKDVFKPLLEVDVSSDARWRRLCHFETIRDCLLHANGRIDFYRKENALKEAIKKLGGCIKINNKRIELTDECLQSFHETIVSLLRIDGL